MKNFKTNYEWEPFTSYRDITYPSLGYIVEHKFRSNRKILQMLKEYKLKNRCNVATVYSKYKPTIHMSSRKLCQYGYIRRFIPLWIKSHGTRRPISYYRKRDVNDS